MEYYDYKGQYHNGSELTPGSDEAIQLWRNLQVGAVPLAGATWTLFGDSITELYAGTGTGGDDFASRIANEFGMKLDNRGKSGSNIYAGGSGNYTDVSGIVMLDAFLAEIDAGTIAQPGYITVAFGTNTFTNDIGTNDDTSETHTASTYGATKYFIEKLREKCPHSSFGFILPPRHNWSRDVDGGRAAIKAVCDDYGVPYVDMSQVSGITGDMLPDGVHTSDYRTKNLYYHALRGFMIRL